MEETTRQERAYWADVSAVEADARHNAEIMNDILTIEQALAVLTVMRACPEAAVYIAEDIFEKYGWPADNIAPGWLDTAGMYTLQILRMYQTREIK